MKVGTTLLAAYADLEERVYPNPARFTDNCSESIQDGTTIAHHCVDDNQNMRKGFTNG
jgi:hypothetical protein